MKGASYLRDFGFEYSGHWSIANDRLRLTLDRNGDRTPALYAFVVDGEVRYVGKTANLLRARLQGYITPGPSQRTSLRVHTLQTPSSRSGPSSTGSPANTAPFPSTPPPASNPPSFSASRRIGTLGGNYQRDNPLPSREREG
ncbi:MAG: hypothetical protein ACO1SV_03480 [Fimbriimonas sp.]